MARGQRDPEIDWQVHSDRIDRLFVRLDNTNTCNYVVFFTLFEHLKLFFFFLYRW